MMAALLAVDAYRKVYDDVDDAEQTTDRPVDRRDDDELTPMRIIEKYGAEDDDSVWNKRNSLTKMSLKNCKTEVLLFYNEFVVDGKIE